MGNSISSPPSSTSLSLFRNDLDRLDREKANKDWVTSELKSLGKSLDNTSKIATEAEEKAGGQHMCVKEKDIEKLQAWHDKFMSWKMGGILALIVAVSAGIAQYFSLKDAVDDGAQDRIVMQETLKTIAADKVTVSKKAIKEVVRDMTENERIVSEKRNKKRNEEIRKLFKEVVAEVRADIKP